MVVVLVCLWKFKNDLFNRFCCWCCGGAERSKVRNLQQENQRLRQQLSQHRLSVSGRMPPGQFCKSSNLHRHRNGGGVGGGDMFIMLVPTHVSYDQWPLPPPMWRLSSYCSVQSDGAEMEGKTTWSSDFCSSVYPGVSSQGIL